MIEPKYRVRRIATKLDDYAETLHTGLKADAGRNKRYRCTKGQMWQDLCALVYIGGCGLVCAIGLNHSISWYLNGDSNDKN